MPSMVSDTSIDTADDLPAGTGRSFDTSIE